MHRIDSSSSTHKRDRRGKRKSRSGSGVEVEASHSETEFTIPSSPPLLSFGLLTDVQYADVEDGWNYAHTTQRFYRNAFVLMERAIDDWLSKPLSFAVNLGDLIDGKSKRAGTTRAALDRMRGAWKRFEDAVGPVHHLLGNHELYNMTQKEFDVELRWSGARQTYYDFVVDSAPRCRFVVLNPYGMTSLGRQPDDPIFQAARNTLRLVNPNDDLNSPLGLRGEHQRFVEYNGGVDAEQLEWLRATLRGADAGGENVVIFSHIPVHPASCPPTCLLWNYADVLAAIDAHTCVRAVFSGHVHSDGYALDKGVHYIVCDAMLECAPGETAHATVDVFEDGLVINGQGKIPSRALRFSFESEASRETAAMR
ncbi:hypothetical protein ATCC90586_008065 [Pythium insidiosum]|nr:hypothetical protein ATCC90586_008065 [Pythium insidiosum]